MRDRASLLGYCAQYAQSSEVWGMSVSKEKMGSDYVQSLARGLAVIQTFSADRPRMTMAEVAEETDLTRSTARRLLLTLEELGYVRSNGRAFELTPRVLALGYAYLSSVNLGELAAQPMQTLVAEAGEASGLTVLDRDEIVYIGRVPVDRLLTVSVGIGSRLPAHATSMGHVLLAGLSDEGLDAFLGDATLERFTAHTITTADELRHRVVQTRARGWALADQEYELGVRSVAVPVRGRDGGTVAALNISSHAGRSTTGELRDRFLPLVQEAAKEISVLLSHSARS